MIPTAALRQRITITPYTGHGAYGPTWGTPVVNVPARWSGKRRAVRKSDGTDVIASAVADVRPSVQVAAESKVTYAGRDYVVLDVLDVMGLTRLHHRQLILEGPT